MICNNIVVYNTNEQLSDHFKCSEFVNPSTGLTLIDPKLIWMLEAIRTRTGSPLYIRYGNDGNSLLHYCGMAATFYSDDVNVYRLEEYALAFIPKEHVSLDGDALTIDSNY